MNANKILSAMAAIVALSACTGYKTLSPADFEAQIASDTLTILDVRTPEEFSEDHIPGAINIDWKDPAFIDSVKAHFDTKTAFAVYCRSGKRSAEASAVLDGNGYRTYNLDGGILAWKESGRQVCDDWQYIVKDGDEAPDFTVNLMDGSQIKLSDLRGKVVMIQFTASWCSVCRGEMPHIESDIWQPNKENPDFVLIGIDREEDRETMEKFIEVTGITYPLAFDPTAEVYDKYAVHNSGITRNVLIDRDGKIVLRTRLYNEEAFSALVAKINELLAK